MTSTTLPPPVTVPALSSPSAVASSFSPDILEYAMIAVFAGVIIYVAYKLFRKPSYRYWLRLIDGNEEKEIPLTRIDEVNLLA